MLDSLDPPLTKRQLGWLIAGAGVLLALAALAADWLGAGRFSGLGPTQIQALGAGGLLLLFGLSLTRLGSRPAAGAAAPLPGQPAAGWAGRLPRAWRWLIALLFGLAALALIGQLLVYFHYTASLLRFPFDYDQGEGFELYDTLLHAQGRWPYQDSQVFPFYTSIYPPLFHLLTVPLVWLFGPQMWTGRLVGFAASLVTAAAIGLAVHQASRGRAPVLAAFSGLAFLASNYTFHIGPLFRQHMTMVMFETLGILALSQEAAAAPEAPRRAGGLAALWPGRSVWIGMFFLVAAGYSKPLALPSVLAGLAYLFLRGPRRAALAGIVSAAAAAGVFACIDWLTQGWWTVSVVRANINAYDAAQALMLYRQWAGLHGILLVAALARLAQEVYWTRLSAYGVWFAFAAANGVSAGKFGAGESYFVTATAAACILSGLAFTGLWTRLPDLSRSGTRLARLAAAALALAIPLLYLAQARLTLHIYTEGPVYAPVARLLGVAQAAGPRGYYDSQGYTQLGPRPSLADHQAGQAIAALARAAPGPVFSEEAGFLFAAGKPIVTNPFPQLVMYQGGLFDPAQEIGMIQARAFGLVILRAQFYPPPVLQALGAHYQPWTEIEMNGFVYRILEPRP